MEVRGKNLLTGRLYFTNYSSNASYVYNEDEVTLPYTPPSETRGIGYVVPCKPGVQYTFSDTNPNKNWWLGITEYENFEQAKSILNKIGYQQGIEKSSIKYTAVGNGVLVCVIAGKWTDGKTTTHECTESELLQLEIGSEATTYEPYRTPIAGKWTDGKTTTHECTESELLQLEIGSEATTYEPYRTPQILTLQTPNGLPGVPVSKDGNYTDSNGQQWVCDEIDLGRGKYVQRVNNFVFNDKALFGVDIEAKHENSILINIPVTDASNFKTLGANSMLCDRLKACEYNIYSMDEVSCGYTGGANYLRVRLPISAGTEIEEIKNYLADKSFKILYIIATPIERDLTPEEIAAYKALRTYGPTTVVSSDAGVHMEVTYVADTKNYIRNLEQRLSAKLVNIQSALISQKTSRGGVFNNSR